MGLKAKIDGQDIISVFCTDEDWADAQIASKGKGHRLRMSCCDAPAYASHSRLDLRYFAHKGGHERCPSGGESEEHACLKAAAAMAVQSFADWKADVEVSGEGWRADVLAIRGSVRIAIEVQLSAQAKRETGTRNDRFEESEVSAFWLKGQKNHFNDFGDGLQAPVKGNTLHEQMASVRIAVSNLIKAVERQVKMANELAKLVRSIPGWRYKIEKQGTIPACFELHRGGKQQQILLGELGPSLLPTIFHLVDGKQIGADQFAGAILQLRVDVPHLRGYQSSSFQLDREDVAASLDRELRPILEGRKKWQGKEHKEIVSGVFVHYSEECISCSTRFLRITHKLIGHPKHPKSNPVKVIGEIWDWTESMLDKAEALSKKTGLVLGPIKGETSSRFSSIVQTGQICPQCSAAAPEPLISDEEALQHWPGRDEHFRFQLSSPGKGWGEVTSWEERPFANSGVWETLLARKRAIRQEERDEDRRRQELAAAEAKRKREEWQRLAEEQRLQREAEKKRAAAELFRREAEERLERIETTRGIRRSKLEEAANIIKDPRKRELWLTTSNPKLRASPDAPSPRPIELAAESKEGLEKVLDLLSSTKF